MGEIEESSINMAETNELGKKVSKKLKVAGNCAMCEARISKAAQSIPGVVAVSWNKDTKMMSVDYNEDQTDLNTIEKTIAEAGHDTANHKAKETTYNNLPACCHYERIQ